MEAKRGAPLVLIVDDTPRNLQLLGALLKKQGYSIVLALDGIQALDAVEKKLPDLILLDVMMPKLNGFETCKRLKENPATRDIPVIFLTARVEEQDIVKGFKLGAVDYVTKPFNTTELVARCRTHLTLRALQLDLEQLVSERTEELQRAVMALKGRDALLKHLLYMHNSDETLALSVKLALGLCNCDFGALYLVDENGNRELRAAVQHQNSGSSNEVTDAFGADFKEEPTFDEAVQTLKPALTQDPGPERAKLGIHSYGVLPICRGNELLALLELGRNQVRPVVQVSDFDPVEEFLPYVAMAVADYRLRERAPDWSQDVDEILKETEEWTE